MVEKLICSAKLLFAEGHFSMASGYCISMLNALRALMSTSQELRSSFFSSLTKMCIFILSNVVSRGVSCTYLVIEAKKYSG